MKEAFFAVFLVFVFIPTTEFKVLAGSPVSQPSASEGEPKVSSFYQLKQISLESSPSQVQIRIEATGGLSQLRQERMLNPGRLIIEIPRINNALNLNINQLTDHSVIPRIRLAQHPDRLRIIVDTVVREMPPFILQKSDRLITLTIEKSPEILQEAKSRSDLFLAMQRNDREALLKLGSEDEGGILFADQTRTTSNGKRTASMGGGSGAAPGINVEKTPGTGNRVVFLLDDRREYKIFIEDTQTPIHIKKIRPSYEVKGIQARLNQLGYDTGLEDGSVGPQTHAALQQFQKDHGLPVTGTPNKNTQRELRKQFGY